MTDRMYIRLSSSKKELLENKASELGFNNCSEFARHLIDKGLERITLNPAEYHLLSHTSQSVMLLREILNAISANDSSTSAVIENIKNNSTDWLNKFQETLKT